MLSLDCKGNETLSTCSVSRIGINNHTRDSGVVCEQCVNCCAQGSCGEACFQTEQTTTLTASPAASQPTGLVIISSCSSDTLGVILGVTLVTLAAVVVGWTISCILMWKKMKGDKSFDNANQGYGEFMVCLCLQQ